MSSVSASPSTRPPARSIHLACKSETSFLAVSGESFPEPSAFFTGAKSSSRTPRRNATGPFANAYASKMNASSLIPFGDFGATCVSGSPPGSQCGIFFFATWYASSDASAPVSSQHLARNSKA